MSMHLRYLASIVLLLLVTIDSQAQAPMLINFQAQVDGLGATETPVTFSIYDTPTGGTALWDETQSITPINGVIQVLLGSATTFPTDLFKNNGARYLDIEVGGESLTPRFQLTSVSYALRAAIADDVQGDLVSTVNGIAGDVVLKEGANVTISQDGEEITIASAGAGGGSIQTVSGGDAISVEEPNGPAVVVNVEADALNDSHIEDNALTESSLAANSVGTDELAPNTAVTAINDLQNGVNLVGGTNITITPDGQDLRIDAASVSGGSGIQNLLEGAGIDIDDADGPTTTVALAENQITDIYVADNSLTATSLAPNSVGTDEIQTNAVGDAELQDQLIIGPDGSLNISNAANQVVTTLNSSEAGGAVFVNQPGNGFTGGALTIRNLGGQGAGGQLQLRGNPNWDAIHMFSDGDTQGGRMLFREPSSANPQDAVTTLTMRGEDEKGHIIVFNNNTGFISIGGDQQEIRTRGNVGIGLTSAEYNMLRTLDEELFVRGDAFVTGTFTNATSRLAVDHPTDPQNMVLTHSGVVSSEMLTMYHGMATLDENGEATVKLPDWFESLNKDFRYQLTCIGGWARIYIAQKIENNTFVIAGGRPNMEVSWQITAVRNDPYAQSNPIQVETTKNTIQQGQYIHPEAYGVSGNQ